MNSPARTVVPEGVSAVDARRLSIVLSDGKFHKGASIGMDPRSVRAIIAAYPDQYLSTPAGFKLFRYASDGEIDVAIAGLRSRARNLIERADGHEAARRARSGQKELFTQTT